MNKPSIIVVFFNRLKAQTIIIDFFFERQHWKDNRFIVGTTSAHQKKLDGYR